jgi:uncharacterized protein involved in exopolysaccharide biosynthesis
MFLSIGISALVYLLTPKEYKSSTTISIQSAFFSAPLASALIPSITDPAEINSERNAILENALDEPFIDELAEDFKIYTTPPKTRARGTERALFRNKIETAKSGSGFQISISSNDAHKAFNMISRISDHLMEIIKKYHNQQLLSAEKVLETRVDFLSTILANAGNEKAKLRVKTRLIEIRAKIASLRSRYTEEHPLIKSARLTEEELSSALDELQPKQPIKVPEGIAIDTVNLGSETNQQLYGEMVNLLSKLKIMIALEGNHKVPANVSIVSHPQIPLIPFKPQKERYLAIGIVIGIIMSTLLVFRFEKASIPHEVIEDQEIADIFHVPLLGELPILKLK